MTNLRLGLCQMSVVDDKEENIKKAIEMISRAIAKNTDFIVLPEMFNCPYENEKFVEYCENQEDSYTLNNLSDIAEKNNIYVLGGSIPEKEDNRIYNTSYLFDRNGDIIAKHRKIHLFDVDVEDGISFKESDTLTAGNDVTVAETDFGKIGIGICFDIRFPELARQMIDKGARILFYPGAFNLTTGPAHWELSFRARSLDNQAYCVGVAPALDKTASYNSYGHSIITNPWGEVVVEGGYSEELVISDINLDYVKKVRDELPLLKNRRLDVY